MKLVSVAILLCISAALGLDGILRPSDGVFVGVERQLGASGASDQMVVAGGLLTLGVFSLLGSLAMAQSSPGTPVPQIITLASVPSPVVNKPSATATNAGAGADTDTLTGDCPKPNETEGCEDKQYCHLNDDNTTVCKDQKIVGPCTVDVMCMPPLKCVSLMCMK